MITTNLTVQPPTALIQNNSYAGFLADLATLNSMQPMSQGPVTQGGWTVASPLAQINGLYSQSFVMQFSTIYNLLTYRGPYRLGFQPWDGI